jgi:hypothetical protein
MSAREHDPVMPILRSGRRRINRISPAVRSRGGDRPGRKHRGAQEQRHPDQSDEHFHCSRSFPKTSSVEAKLPRCRQGASLRIWTSLRGSRVGVPEALQLLDFSRMALFCRSANSPTLDRLKRFVGPGYWMRPRGGRRIDSDAGSRTSLQLLSFPATALFCQLGRRAAASPAGRSISWDAEMGLR